MFVKDFALNFTALENQKRYQLTWKDMGWEEITIYKIAGTM